MNTSKKNGTDWSRLKRYHVPASFLVCCWQMEHMEDCGTHMAQGTSATTSTTSGEALLATVRLCTSCLHGAIRLPHLDRNCCRDRVVTLCVTLLSLLKLLFEEVTVFSVTVTCFPFTILSKWKHCHDDAERQDLGIENHTDRHDQHTFVHFYIKYRVYAGLYP